MNKTTIRRRVTGDIIIVVPAPNLRNANLRDANLTGANLRDANLRDANLRDANLMGANLTGANLTGANLRNANLRDANLRNANLRDANLTGANLTGANLTGANLTGANLMGANLRNAGLWKYAKVQFSEHGECGRELLAIVQEEGQDTQFFCGCFYGKGDDLTRYISEGNSELFTSRVLAMNVVIELLKYSKS